MTAKNLIQPDVFGRFTGERGRAKTIEALKDQRIVLGNGAASEELLARGEVINFMPGDVLIAEGDWSDSFFLILVGAVRIEIKGTHVSDRVAGQHVGEMAMIDPSKARSAQVTATVPTVALMISEEDFAATAANRADLWRQIAKELAERLRERSKRIRQSNTIPHVFIASASESVAIAESFKAKLELAGAVAKIWTEGVFAPGDHTLESLAVQLELMDFAVAIFSPDDKVKSRGKEKSAPRDNTVFELGLFAGKIGRERSFFAVPQVEHVKIPSDLAGITSVRYSIDPLKGLDVDVACEAIANRIKERGCR
ncbi:MULTISPECIES: TIR domain-containing protein [Rhizobium]|uniref:Cyclic nucleotide-binding domain-containing protein n=1 Tax=Rhizobium leguminosarum bv. viciae TaxID=387 RepID=A0A8G2IQY4_RHILV|nr:TIR domain-containing protein [Rhizobium leguminosarum]NKK11033.1 cyclic nucleotide-binding domain-containing protein [Rhizobium leguminosarum bv. viciae]NKK19420.1 cyclic nucleotide-binding domain-containing protein [Rhizobium leguminosarum bv. viciae]TBX85235.1 cyclic nucleotide-binding domain-containing protein [Rhizobium leguminosarum bv. viciae]TBZ08642.1 cyclic nucleotide-binding domain-containing protein [Rhizobium leguminosarum bv. viciae]